MFLTDESFEKLQSRLNLTAICVNIECDWGWFGPNCGVECSETCFGRACNSNNGTCIRCVPGRTGSFCNQIIGSGDGNITTDIGVDSASRTTSRTSIIGERVIQTPASCTCMGPGSV